MSCLWPCAQQFDCLNGAETPYKYKELHTMAKEVSSEKKALRVISETTTYLPHVTSLVVRGKGDARLTMCGIESVNGYVKMASFQDHRATIDITTYEDGHTNMSFIDMITSFTPCIDTLAVEGAVELTIPSGASVISPKHVSLTMSGTASATIGNTRTHRLNVLMLDRTQLVGSAKSNSFAHVTMERSKSSRVDGVRGDESHSDVPVAPFTDQTQLEIEERAWPS